jgi:hypothetical protein
MVFARKSDAALASLAKQIDKKMTEHADKKLSSFINLLGDDREALEKSAKDLATSHKLDNVPVVVPVEFEDGPKDFGVNPKAEVTVILYTGLKVKANHAFAPGAFNDKGVAAVMADLPKILE